MIPLYVIEEHHEAFYIWNYAVSKDFLPVFGNTLLHVDHHPDFEHGFYNASLDALFSSLEDMRSFTYKGVGIADFICPAIYQCLFNEIVMVMNFAPFISKPVEKVITKADEMMLEVRDISPVQRLELLRPECDCRMFTYRQGGLGAFSTAQTIALDIDLDYFCWDDTLSSIADKSLEITEQAYVEVTRNPYHPFRLFPKMWLTPVEKEDKFYLRYLDTLIPPILPEKELILKRIALFIEWLKRNRINASIISVCRSRYSGYTPVSVWEEIENNLLKGLSEVYDYDLQS